MRSGWKTAGLVSMGVLSAAALQAAAGDEFPPFEKIVEGYERVQTASGESGLYSVYTREKDAQVLAELPRNFEGKRFYLAATIAGGSPQTGVYSIWNSSVGVPTKTVYWSRRGNRLALIEPNLSVRSSGDQESKAGVARVNTDTVVLSVPILGFGPGGGPVVDMDQALIGNSSDFLGRFLSRADVSLARITKAKVFPKNIELGFELPRANGQLATVRFSLGMPDKAPGFKPREADRRVGIYYEAYEDRARNDGQSQVIRYANRWHIEKADPSLAMSPPKQPIVYHIEHTTPIRYRRWVREGILKWNQAFEQVGIVGAIEVRQQDATTGAYMDIDPEDIRYSFVRWTNAGMGFAIGPVHSHPDTGQIYEADIVMDEGFIGSYANQYLQTELAAAAMSTMHPELSSWLAENPSWDPRVLLAAPQDRAEVIRRTQALAAEPERAAELLVGASPTVSAAVWAPHRGSSVSAQQVCMAQPGLASSVGAARLAMDMGIAGFLPRGEESDESILDGLPESFVGPMLRDVVMHEVGHTMGMMHNWKGSALHGVYDINSGEFDGTIQSTVMDYAPMNLVVEDEDRGVIQGPYMPTNIGPYDMWAIEWNYTFGDPDEVAARASEHGHAFMAEDGQFSPDPQAKTWDMGENSLDFCDERMRFVDKVRGELLDRAVEDGESWARARQVYSQMLGLQMGAVSTATHWIGGAHIERSNKGDEGANDPVRPVDVERQRRALAFVVDYGLNADSFGLDPAILAKLQSENWYDEGFSTTHAWPVHDSVLGVQSSAMSMLLNPTRLGRVMDNELRTPEGEDALTVPEVMNAIRAAVWADPESRSDYSAREPMIGSLQRHLQMEHLSRMIDLGTGMWWPGATGRTVQSLARQELEMIGMWAKSRGGASGIDAYSSAHLADVAERVERALAAEYFRKD